MNQAKIIKQLEEVFRDVFEDSTLIINEDSNHNSIPEWDSIKNIYLVIEIEQKFGIKFSTEELQDWKNVGQIIDNITELNN